MSDSKKSSSGNKQSTSDAIAKTTLFFSDETPLRNSQKFGGRPYEKRKQQEVMAVAVSEALEKGHNLCVEAPTGVGKSFAYLVPAIYHALSVHKTVLVTTETINLQEQLVQKDLPLLKDILGIQFTYAIAKGRGNYLCKRRLALISSERNNELFAFSPTSSAEIGQLNDWAKNTNEGSKSEISFRIDARIWNSVCSETVSCLARNCPYFQNCFYWKLRRQWDKADIIVTNHALFFMDLRFRALKQNNSTLLPDYSAVIFDEAHTLEDNAATHLGIHINSSSFHFFLSRLFNPSNGKGLLMKPGESSMALRGLIARLNETSKMFFGQFESEVLSQKESCIRVREAGKFHDNITKELLDLKSYLSDYTENQEDSSFKAELQAETDRCAAFQNDIDFFIQMRDSKYVYWVEENGSSSQTFHQTDLMQVPLDVADLLSPLLFQQGIPIILTSATLAIRHSLDFYVKRVGFCYGEGLILDSPFKYEEQVVLYVSKNMPQPSEEGFASAAVEKIKKFIDMTSGNAFVLFTSYSFLHTCAERISGFCSMKGFPLLIQGDSYSRSTMISKFKSVSSSVIFGATSFWTGVDVPGEALSNVIITKLPFSVPNHPLIEARCEKIKECGGEPFRDYSIPDAVLKFRQGIGRLIRSTTDHGIIVVLDSRIVSKSYGRTFLASIPNCPIKYF